MMTLAFSLLLAPVAMQAAAPATVATTAAPEKPICRRTESTGSIMPGKRTCHSKAEWAAIDGAHSDDMQKMRDRGGMNSPR